MLVSILNKLSDLSVRNGFYVSSLSAPWCITCALRGVPLSVPMSGGYQCYNPSVFALLLVPPGT